MKKLLLLIALIPTLAFANENNTMVERCIKSNPDIQSAWRCWNEWKVAAERLENERQKQFLDHNPWFRGNNWQWKDHADYRCERIYNNHLMNNITVCSKPIYLN